MKLRSLLIGLSIITTFSVHASSLATNFIKNFSKVAKIASSNSSTGLKLLKETENSESFNLLKSMYQIPEKAALKFKNGADEFFFVSEITDTGYYAQLKGGINIKKLKIIGDLPTSATESEALTTEFRNKIKTILDDNEIKGPFALDSTISGASKGKVINRFGDKAMLYYLVDDLYLTPEMLKQMDVSTLDEILGALK